MRSPWVQTVRSRGHGGRYVAEVEQRLLSTDKMNKKRFFLDPPEVKDYLVKGERFTKWSEVSESLNVP